MALQYEMMMLPLIWEARRCVEFWVRRRSHYGGNDGGGSGNGDGYVMWRVGHTVNIPKGYCKEQRENGRHRSLVDLLFSLYQLGGGCANHRNRLRRTMFVLRRQRCLWRSRELLSRLFFVPSLLALPPFQDIIRSLRAPRRFWAAPRQRGFWEKDVCEMWRRMGRRYPDWEESQYLHFRMSKDTFWYLSQMYGKYLEKETTHLRRALPQAKRLAIVLHWLAQASSFAQIAALYAIGKSTVVAVVHQGIDVLRVKLVPEAIRFPTGSELE